MVAKLKLKGIDGRAPPGVEPAAEFDSTRETSPGPDTERIDRLIALSRFCGWCAWPFLVGGAICLVNSDNERDSSMLNSYAAPRGRRFNFLEGQVAFSHARWSNNRSVM